ncbi:CD59 glycoprotein-like [Boleophthalmus pectinirostris]|uniref:CD59 glycoprotein-like n=1 Tax=Boleophthalmus pectinirostris TaxID=150288 RepID=UPI00243149D6|nr:CD59 glycoprotein-like [Boleophthalmus pectinirostris]
MSFECNVRMFTMKSAVLFCLVVAFSGFQFGMILQCYSCRNGSTKNCDLKEECTNGLNSCLKLKHGEMTYSSCVNYNDCTFDALSLQYTFSHFTFSCCQSNLCNGRSLSEKISDFFG